MLGNIIVCVIVYKYCWILYLINDFVISLVLLDILILIILLFLIICLFIGGLGCMFGRIICFVYVFFNDFVKYVFIYILCFIVINCYYRFLKLVECYEIFIFGYILIMLICIWIGLFLFVGLFVMVGWVEYVFSYDYLGCLVKYN